MRTQLRPFYTPTELARVYDTRYDHTLWLDHIERVAETVRALDEFAAAVNAATVADLSCGDGAVLNQSTHPWEWRATSDITRGGPIEKMIHRIPAVDMFVCSETIEHLEDPDSVLAAARRCSRHMLLTTPHGETGDDNWEHYWGWDLDGVQDLLRTAGWRSCTAYLWRPETPCPYTFQIWTCS